MVTAEHAANAHDGSVPVASRGLSPAERADLARAVAALERSSFASGLSGMIGRQVGFAGDFIPKRVADVANAAAAKALDFALRGALRTLTHERRPAKTAFHLAAVAASGAVGGAFGLATLPLELPVSTTLILRAVADIAREEGEDLSTPEGGLACLEVFALGTGDGAGDGVYLGDSGYFAVRTLLAKSVSEAARFMIQRGLGEEAAPVLVRLLGQVASRFGVVVSQKILVQAVPLLGAVTGAAVNAAFMDHYQTLARGHFIVRRLERLHGPEVVREAYEAIRATLEPETSEPRDGRQPASREPATRLSHAAGRTRLDNPM